jgi:DNA helicase II / ATP-dependent DNA helicase PcrA
MSLLKDLNPVQREAVKTIEGPVMIIAGAGSGKTRVLTYRIAYLLECGVPPYNILALTFTNKAAREMRERIESLIPGDEAKRLWMGTFHSTFARLLRRDAEKLGFHKNFSIYDTDDSQNVIKTIMHDMNLNTQQISPSTMRHMISRAKNRLQTPADISQAAKEFYEKKMAEVFEEYGKRLRNSNAMDFDDLITHPIALFDTQPDVLASYQNQFKFILIDEYQDTNQAQYQIVRRLAAAHRNICVVGDDAQSIYAFRGADIRNILEFEVTFENARTFRLEQNYRSTKLILQGADSLIKNNTQQLKKTLWTENDTGEPITILEMSDEMEEAQKIVTLMQDESRKKKLQLKDFAVLYRTNAQSRSLEDAMRRSGIPYTIIGGVEFYRRREIKDVLGYLRLIVNANDDEAFLRVVNYPTRGIGSTTVDRLRAYAGEEGVSLFEAAMNAPAAPAMPSTAIRRLGEFVLLIQKYALLRNEISAGELAGSLVNETGIIAEFKNEGTVEARTRLDNIQELLSALSQFQSANGLGTLEAFLAEASLVADVDRLDPDRNAVTLMTLHAAKGLEFPVVFMTGMEEGLFPSSIAMDNGEVDEERRLCYVGMTRAMTKLYMTHARTRMKWSERLTQLPSRFLMELDEATVHRDSTRRRQQAHTPSLFGDGAARRPATRSRKQASEYSQAADDSYSQVEPEIGPGTIVFHATFGRGTILSINGSGDSSKAAVVFDSVGKKTLVLKYAGLTIGNR